ncbi:MAG: MFS transporter, partial [bacterium]
MLRGFLEKSGIVQKDFFIIFILSLNALVGHYMILIIMGNVVSGLNVTYTESLIIWTVYYITLIGSGIAGSILSKKIGRLNFLYLWMVFGVISSLLLILLNNFTVSYVLTIGVLLGISAGLGIPSCLAYFADFTFFENRGRVSGTILLFTNLSAPLFAISFRAVNLIVNLIIFAIWRGSGLIIFFLKPEEKTASEIKRKEKGTSILHNKPFVLFFTAWFMFLFIDRFEAPILRNFLGDFYSFMLIVNPIVGGLSAFVAGLLSDWIGRKRVVLYGFITYGIAYAVIGIAPASLFSWYFFVVMVSISIGILWVAFVFILWGDLSQPSTSEKYYVIGLIPFFLTSIIQQFSTQYVMMIPEISSFSLASFFLFLAVLPLL